MKFYVIPGRTRLSLNSGTQTGSLKLDGALASDVVCSSASATSQCLHQLSCFVIITGEYKFFIIS